MPQKCNADRFQNIRLSDSRKSRMMSRQDNNGYLAGEEPCNRSENFNRDLRHTLKKNQFCNFLEDMNTDTNHTNSSSGNNNNNGSAAGRSSVSQQKNPVIIKNNINNLSVQITNGEGMNAHLQFSQDNVNNQNMYTFKLNSQQQSPNHLKDLSEQAPGHESLAKQFTPCRDQKVLTSTNERQSRIYALQNIVVQQNNENNINSGNTSNTANVNQPGNMNAADNQFYNQSCLGNEHLRELEICEEPIEKLMLNPNA